MMHMYTMEYLSYVNKTQDGKKCPHFAYMWISSLSSMINKQDYKEPQRISREKVSCGGHMYFPGKGI